MCSLPQLQHARVSGKTKVSARRRPAVTRDRNVILKGGFFSGSYDLKIKFSCTWPTATSLLWWRQNRGNESAPPEILGDTLCATKNKLKPTEWSQWLSKTSEGYTEEFFLGEKRWPHPPYVPDSKLLDKQITLTWLTFQKQIIRRERTSQGLHKWLCFTRTVQKKKKFLPRW